MADIILEIANIEIKPGSCREFIAAVERASSLLKRAKGCRGMELRQVIERPTLFQLLVQWDTVDNHMVDFQGSHAFQEWREQIGPFFATNPHVEHSVRRINSTWVADPAAACNKNQ